MECPECGGNTRVLDSRKYAGAVYRKRKCKLCHFIFWTEEIEQMEEKARKYDEICKFINSK